MNEIINRFFNIKKVKNIFKRNWQKDLKVLIPNSNKALIKDDEFNEIKDGSILVTIGSTLSIIFGTLLSAFVLVQENIFTEGYGTSAFIRALSSQTFTLVIGLIGAIIIPSLIFSYIRYSKENEQTSILFFIILIFSFIGLIGLVFNVIKYFFGLFTAPFFAILSLISLLFSFFGYAYILNGSLNFCIRCNKRNN